MQENMSQRPEVRHISSFVRNDEGAPIGYIVALPVSENEYNIGMSLINPEHDRFNKEKAVMIAYGRAMVQHERKVPGDFYINRNNKNAMNTWLKIYKRCEKYFKNMSPTEYVKEGCSFVMTAL